MTLLKLLKQRGKALVLQGPEGCGKTLLAKQLAEAEGTYSETDMPGLVGGASRFSSWLDGAPDVVIVEGIPAPYELDAVKHLVASPVLLRERKGEDAATVSAPMFIFCTSSPSPPENRTRRRFHVLQMSGMV